MNNGNTNQLEENNMNRLFNDEQGNIITENELLDSYAILVWNHDTEAETFEDYITNCTDGNGTLKEICKEDNNK